MSRKGKKIFLDDFKENYSNKIDTNEVLSNLGIEKDNKRIILRWKKLSYSFMISTIVLFIGLISVVVVGQYWNRDEGVQGYEDIVTEEFEEYVYEENLRVLNNYNVYIMLTNKSKIYIFKFDCNNDATKNTYLFIYKSEFNYDEVKIKINDNIQNLSNNSFGILCECDINDKNPITFSIEINGEIKEYSIAK